MVQTVSPYCGGATKRRGKEVGPQLLEVLLELPEPSLDIGLSLDGLRNALLQCIDALQLGDVQVFRLSLLRLTLDLFL